MGSAISFPVRPAAGKRPNLVENTFRLRKYSPTPTNPYGEHRAADINREEFGVPSISNWIIQLPERARLVAKGYDDEGAGYWMEWLILTGPWKGRYFRVFHLYKACGIAIGTTKARKYAVARVGNTGNSTGAHAHVELGAKKWAGRSQYRDPRWDLTDALNNAVKARDY